MKKPQTCFTYFKLSILLILLSANIYAAEIKKIEIFGLNVISRGTVLSYLPIEVGDEYSEQTSAKIIRTLYKTGFFKDIQVSANQQIVSITLIENPHIKSIQVNGYSDKVIDAEIFKKTLKSINLVQGKIFNKKALDKLISGMRASYIDKGYYNHQINKSVVIDAENRIAINITIKEGFVARIKSMKISGMKVYDEDDLLDLFEIGEADWLIVNYFTEKDHYSKIALDAGIEALKSLYINAGYLDFKLSKTDIDLSENKQQIDIALSVSEGKQYKVGEIEFTGILAGQSIDDLMALMPNKGEVFKRKKIIKSINAITDVFANQGYAFVKIDPIAKENKQQQTVDIRVNIVVNKKTYINRINISGNTRTQDEVIRREITLAEGGLYSNRELDESIKKIKRLGFFSDVKMTVAKVANNADKIDLYFNVKETKTGAFTIGFSQSSNSGTSFELGIKENNFLGTGNVLNASLSNSKAVKDASFYFVDPYFTKDNHSISYGIFTRSVDGSELESGSYKIDESGLSFGYGIPLTKNTRINTDIRVSTRDITCGAQFGGTNGADTTSTSTVYIDDSTTELGMQSGTPDTKKIGNDDGTTLETTTTMYANGTETVSVNDNDYSGYGFEEEQCASDDETEVKINLSWSSNTLNNYNYPTAGSRNKLSFDLTLPIADFRYYKLNASHKSYYPINNNLTLSIKGNVGIAQGYDGKELPFFKRYYGGGSGSVRGFDFNSLGATYTDGKAKGGELLLLAGVAAIAPLKFVKDSRNMRLSAFIDSGLVSEKVSDFDANELRMSAGIAFSWLTPVGPIGIYAAEPLIKKAGDKTKSFEFTLGTRF